MKRLITLFTLLLAVSLALPAGFALETDTSIDVVADATVDTVLDSSIEIESDASVDTEDNTDTEDSTDDSSDSSEETEEEVEDESSDDNSDDSTEVMAVTTTSAQVSSDDDETEREVRDMGTQLGAKMRLLQLERALTMKVIQGKAVIDTLDARDVDTSELSDIIAELEAMIVQVQDLEAGLNEKDNQAAIEEFVQIKHDARALIKEFKELARDLVTPEDRKAMQDALEEARRTALKDLQEKAEQARLEWRAEHTERALKAAGIVDDDLVKRVRDGDANAKEIRDEIKEKIRDFKPEDRRAAIAGVREEQTRMRVKAIQHLDRVEGTLERIQERTDERAKLLEDRGHTAVAERLRLRSEKIEIREGVIVERREKIETRIKDGELREKIEIRERTRSENSGSGSDDDSNDDSSDDDNSDVCRATNFGPCWEQTVGQKCNPDREEQGYECDRVDDTCYGICRVDN